MFTPDSPNKIITPESPRRSHFGITIDEAKASKIQDPCLELDFTQNDSTKGKKDEKNEEMIITIPIGSMGLVYLPTFT